jgi:hypothetical protein
VGQTPTSISRMSRGGHPTRMPLMSALGQKRTLDQVRVMSALPPKADIAWRQLDVRFVPKADVRADPHRPKVQELTCNTCARLHFAWLKLLVVVRRIASRLARVPRRSRYGRFQTNPPFQTTSVGVHGCPTHV